MRRTKNGILHIDDGGPSAIDRVQTTWQNKMISSLFYKHETIRYYSIAIDVQLFITLGF